MYIILLILSFINISLAQNDNKTTISIITTHPYHDYYSYFNETSAVFFILFIIFLSSSCFFIVPQSRYDSIPYATHI